jgi:general secretion pathway protein G
MKTKKGFTLVEILIVVVILGILAAIVIPQFSSASSEAKVSSLTSNLQAIRSQIQLYKIQHGDEYPGYSGGTFGSAKFVTDMTEQTTYLGDTFGPYLQKIPDNPFAANGSDTVSLANGSGTGSLGATNDDWYWDTANYILYANAADDPNKLDVY